jgi:hypothetical protein
MDELFVELLRMTMSLLAVSLDNEDLLVYRQGQYIRFPSRRYWVLTQDQSLAFDKKRLVAVRAIRIVVSLIWISLPLTILLAVHRWRSVVDRLLSMTGDERLDIWVIMLSIVLANRSLRVTISFGSIGLRIGGSGSVSCARAQFSVPIRVASLWSPNSDFSRGSRRGEVASRRVVVDHIWVQWRVSTLPMTMAVAKSVRGTRVVHALRRSHRWTSIGWTGGIRRLRLVELRALGVV